MASRRKVLDGIVVAETTHAGLWLDKYIVNQEREKKKDQDREQDDEGEKEKSEKNARRTLVSEVAGIAAPAAYRTHYAGWCDALAAVHALTAEAEVQVRMAVGLGDEGVLETSIHLHHTYGVPVIPGSALKGLAAAYARKRLNPADWGAETPAYRTVFGDTDEAGYITFYDALYIPPAKGAVLPVQPDVLTVHHKGYYEGKQEGGALVPPADWDSPTIVPFLSATGRYLIALGGQGAWAGWVDAAFDILTRALAELGVGAKTSSGYGRLKVDAGTVKRPFPTTVKPSDASAEPPVTEPGEPAAPVWRAGVVTESKQGNGQIRDDQDHTYHRFGFAAVPAGYRPQKGDKVEFIAGEQAGKRVAVQIRKAS